VYPPPPPPSHSTATVSYRFRYRYSRTRRVERYNTMVVHVQQQCSCRRTLLMALVALSLSTVQINQTTVEAISFANSNSGNRRTRGSSSSDTRSEQQQHRTNHRPHYAPVHDANNNANNNANNKKNNANPSCAWTDEERIQHHLFQVFVGPQQKLRQFQTKAQRRKTEKEARANAFPSLTVMFPQLSPQQREQQQHDRHLEDYNYSNDDAAAAAAASDDATDDLFTGNNELCSQFLVGFLEGTTDARDTCEGIQNAYVAAGTSDITESSFVANHQVSLSDTNTFFYFFFCAEITRCDTNTRFLLKLHATY
jgi:hypothetical protein